MGYYKRHAFFCTNLRDECAERPCCSAAGSVAARAYVKAQIKERGLAGKDGIRVNTSGCLDRCEEGPTIVVYPEAIWYTYVDQEDLDEIIDEHLVNGRVVERLKI